MRHIQNTLYVSQDGAHLHKDGGAIVVRLKKEKIGQFPIIAIGEVVCFGFGVSVSPPLAEYCACQGITVSYVHGTGRFLARMEGPLRGNVLLRRRQYRDSDSPMRSLDIARCCVAAKISNQRNVLLRFLRNHPDAIGADAVRKSLAEMDHAHRKTRSTPSVDTLRGLEGEASASYFHVFDHLILVKEEAWRFAGRSRKPPMDRINALLSFIYSILALDLRSALETVGLDPYVGFLHVERPGRPSLALDMMEEFRAPLADRVVLSLVNLRQVTASGFTIGPAGDVQMTPETRKTVLAAYQNRKREVVQHPFMEEPMEVGIAFLVQARLLARFIRGDLDLYPAFLWR